MQDIKQLLQRIDQLPADQQQLLLQQLQQRQRAVPTTSRASYIDCLRKEVPSLDDSGYQRYRATRTK